MFCSNCGKPVEGEQTLCGECQAKQIPVTNEETTAEQPTPEVVTPVADTFELNTAETEAPAKPKKKKTGLIAGILAAVIVVAAAVGIFLNMDSVNGFVGRTFKSPEDYLMDVESDAIKEYSAELMHNYGKALESYGKNQNALQNAVKSEVGIVLGDDILAGAEAALQQQGMMMELDWLSDIKLSIDTNRQDTATQVGLGIGLGNTHLLSADVIFNMANGIGYVAIPEWNKTYLSGDFFDGMPMDQMQDMLTESMERNEKLVKALPSEEEMSELIDTYANILLSGITNVDKQTDTVTIDDVSQKMVVLTAKLTEKEILNIMEDILKTAQKDKTIEKTLKAVGDYANEAGELNFGYYEPVDMYQEFTDAVAEALESLAVAKGEASDGNYLKLKVYVDMKNNVRGHAVSAYSDGEKEGETISWMTVAKDDTIYTEAELARVRITGEKTEKKDTSDGHYTLYVDGEEIGTLKFKDLTETSGTLRLIPSEETLNNVLSGSGIPSILGQNLALEWSYDMQDAKSSSEVKILVGSKTLLQLTVSSEAGEGGKITIPTDVVRMENEADVRQWMQNADFDELVKALEAAGVPAELVETVKSYVSMLQQSASDPY